MNNTYILSLEGSDIYNHMVRGRKIKDDFSGMIPYSLELIKLKAEGLKVKVNKTNGKESSRDIINVKFKRKVQSGEQIIKNITEKIAKLEMQNDENTTNYIIKLKDFIKLIESEKNTDKWTEVKNDDLRNELYTNGFTITNIDTKTGEITEDKYCVYKRSGSKSRTGQCLFIKENLYQPMINWSRIYLPFVEGMKLDYAGLLSTESLVGSSLEKTIKINPKNILIISDIDSKFDKLCNVIRKDNTTGRLNSFTEEHEIKNSLFDGESLLSSEFFEDGQSMLLLRNHMFKSASFNCNIQDYLKDNCPDDVEFENWKIKNMFNQSMYAKDILCICTPTSLKVLKFDVDLNMTQKEIWQHWKKIVKADKCVFGVCKHEKESKRGKDDEGNILQQTSYQMLSSINFDFDNIEELITFEKSYIMKLKNDNEFFLDFALDRANEINANEMFVEIARQNKDFINAKIFRDFRKREINSYVDYCKSGKIRLVGDYCVLLGNPMEYLQHTIGKFDINTVDVDKLPLKNNEIYTTLHDFDKELTCFRNPHTSPSNVLIAKNTKVKDIDTYFDLSPQIVCVNGIEFPLQDILSGCDYDSDSMAIFDNTKLLEIAKKADGKYNVCINDVKSNKKQYQLTTKDMCAIDNQLATSQRNIGKVVNMGMLCLSTYWDLLKSGKTEKELYGLIKKVDVTSILSGICIDLAKKLYDIDIKAEINFIAKTEQLRKIKPTFFKNISQSETIEDKVIDYDCPMDYLNKAMKLPDAGRHTNIEFNTLLVKHNVKKGNRHQENDVITYVDEMNSKINSIYAVNCVDNDEIEERDILVDNVIKYYNYYVQKLTVKPDTMYSILSKVINNHSKVQSKLLNILFTTQKDVFLQTFKSKKA